MALISHTWAGTHGAAVTVLVDRVGASWGRAADGEADGLEGLLGTHAVLAGGPGRQHLQRLVEATVEVAELGRCCEAC